jgi:biopolymer transport protein TolQ
MKEPISQLADSSFLKIILQSGTISIVILAVLLSMSILSWAVIGWKWAVFRISVRQAALYLKNLNLLEGLSDARFRSESYDTTYFAKEFQAAYAEFAETHKRRQQSYYLGDKQDFLLRIERSIEKCIVTESIHFEKALVILATISSSAPFIGLFGTVTGIIDAFYNIGTQGASSIAVVAPGISAALVATAFGLFAAIPALMAYNVFRNKTRIIRQEMESFGFDLINLFDKEFSKSVSIAKPVGSK